MGLNEAKAWSAWALPSHGEAGGNADEPSSRRYARALSFKQSCSQCNGSRLRAQKLVDSRHASRARSTSVQQKLEDTPWA